jgi:AcrR family transcriptional regulator
MEIVPSANGRTRGRPRGARKVQRNRLVAAAEELLGAQVAQEPNLRQIAHLAGVTPALAHYYFRNRDGLLEALLVERIAPRIEDLVAAARARAGQPQLALTFLIQRTCSLLAGNLLLRRCLWLPLPAARNLRNQLRACLRELLVRAQNMQAVRTDLSADYLTDSLLGVVLFPFLDADPQTDAGGDRVAQLTLQHVTLLRDGIVRGHKPRQESAE